MGTDDEQGWSLCQQFMQACWQGNVDAVIEQLKGHCRQHGVDYEHPMKNCPHEPITTAIRYLTNNRNRMDYPRYRARGLPVTSAPMESFIKQMNHRVKGTEMFWDDPPGAEAMLTLRAAVISDDDRLGDYLTQRPGHPYRRRTTKTAPTTAT